MEGSITKQLDLGTSKCMVPKIMEENIKGTKSPVDSDGGYCSDKEVINAYSVESDNSISKVPQEDIILKNKQALYILRKESEGIGCLPTGNLTKTHPKPFERAAIVIHGLDGKLVEDQEALEIAKHLLFDDFVKKDDGSKELFLCSKCPCNEKVIISDVLDIEQMIDNVKKVLDSRVTLCTKCNGPYSIKNDETGAIDITNLLLATYGLIDVCRGQEILSINENLIEIACENIYYSTQPINYTVRKEAIKIKSECTICGFKVNKRKPVAYQPQIVVDELYRQIGTSDPYNLYLIDICSIMAGLWAGAYGQEMGAIEACSGYFLPSIVDYAAFFGDLSIPVSAWSLKGLNNVANKFKGAYPFISEISKATFFHMLYRTYNYPEVRNRKYLLRAIEARAIGTGAYVNNSLGAMYCGYKPIEYRMCGWANAIVHDSVELCHDITFGEPDNIVALICGQVNEIENFDLPSVLAYLYEKSPKTELYWRTIGGNLTSHVVLLRYGILDHRRRFMKIFHNFKDGWDPSILTIMPGLTTNYNAYNFAIESFKNVFHVDKNKSTYESTMEILNSVCLTNPNNEECDKIRSRLLIGIWSEGSDGVVAACAEWLMKHLCLGCSCQPLNICKHHTGYSVTK